MHKMLAPPLSVLFIHSDIDECGNGNGGCSDTCLNRVGTFECSCPMGKNLGPNMKTCMGMKL